MKKFIETNETDEWEVFTDTGWSEVRAIGKTVEYEVYEILLDDGISLKCADNHILFDSKYNDVYTKDLTIGTKLITDNGINTVISVTNLHYTENMFDLQLDDINHRYYINNILSHNSLWLGNLAHNITRYGHNVALVTLELSEKKYLKRIASNAMNIPIDTYAEFINDTDALKDKIKDYVSTDGQTLIIPGKLIIKEFPASSISANDLESYMKKLEETTKLKFDVIVIDYLNLMNDARQSSADGTYLKIKNIAEQLRSLAMRKEYAVITATQTNRGGIGKQGVLEMNDVSESIGLPQTVDALFSITKDMIDENNGKYTLGATALRDAEGMGEKNQFDFNKKYMRITEEIQDSNNVLNADIMNIDMMI